MAVEKQTAQLIVEVDQKSASQAEKEIKRLGSPEAVKMAFDLGALRQQLSLVQGQIRLAEKSGNFTAALDFRGSAETLKKQIALANRELLNFTRTGNKEVSVLGQLFDNLGKRIGGTSGSIVSQLGSAANNMKSFVWAALTGAGIVGLAAGLTSIGKSALFLGDRLEQATISFEVMLGSADKAKNLLADLSEFAKRTPFELLGIRDVAKQLLAFGITNENLLGTLKALGDVAAGTGTGLDRIAYAFGQVRAAGKLTGNELRQFTEAWVPLLAELAKMYGVTEWAARQMITDNLVGFNDVQQAFVNMTSEGGKFFNLMDRQSLTLTGKISNLKDSFNQLLEEGGGGLVPFAKTFIDALNSILKAANVFFINLYGGFKLLQAWMTFLINSLVLGTQKLIGGIQIAGNNIVGVFKDMYTNAGILANNVGVAFRKIPSKIAEALNVWIQKLEDFLNKASNGVSNFAKKFGFDIDLWAVKLGRITPGGGDEQYKEFVQTNQKIADERNKAIREDIKAKEDLARKVNEMGALETDRVIREAEAKLNSTRELNFELTKSDAQLTKDSKKGSGDRAAAEKAAAKEKEQLQKDSLKNAQNVIKDEIKAQEELQKEYTDTIKKLKDWLEDLAEVTKKLKDLNNDTADKVADRYTQIGEKITDIKDKLQDFTAEEINFANQVKDSIGNLTNKDAFSIWGKDLTVSDIKEIAKLQEELAALEKERDLAKANTTDQAIKWSQASDTEKILAEAAAKQAELEQERLDIETRLGYKEEEARRELEILEQKKLENAAVIEAYKSVVDTVEKEITAVTKTETDARMALYQLEINRLHEVARARLAAGFSTGGAWPATNTNNNTNNNNIIVQANVSSDVDIDKLWNTLVKKINNSNKWVN